jgi:hypothetical protein
MIANPIPWPDGARCAVAMTWDMDADSAFNWYNQQTADNLVAAQSWTRYDPLIAIPRLVEQFARRDLRLTFFVPGWVIEKYPAQIDLLLKNGHEIALHGYLLSGRTRSTRMTSSIGSAAGSKPIANVSAPGRAAGGRPASRFQNIRCATCSKRVSSTTPR